MTNKEQFEQELKQYIESIEDNFKKETSFGDRVADKIAEFGGSWTFIWFMTITLVLWILLNTLAITKAIHWDEPPYILLNLCLSFLASFQAPVILMSANRSAKRDRYYADIDFRQNYISERQTNEMHIHVEETAEAAKEIKEMYAEMQDMYPMIKDIHQYISENGWNRK